MASIVMADSLDSYAALSELASSGRFAYTPANSIYGQATLVAGGGRYGGNAIRCQCVGVNAGFVGNSQITTGYNSNYQVPITIPGYMSGSWVTNPYYSKSLQFGFWFKSVTTNSGTISNVAILGQSINGSAATVLFNNASIQIGNFLVYTPPASVTTQGTLGIYQLGSGGLYAQAACPPVLNDGNWHWIELCIFPNASSYNASPAQLLGSTVAPNFWAKVYVDQQVIINVGAGGLTVPNSTAQTAYASFYMMYNGYIGISQVPSNPDGNYFDDMIVCVSPTAPSFPFGPRRMACLRPNADGDVIGYVPTGSSDNYSAINKGYSNTTSFVQSTGFNVEDRYKFPALSYVPQNVNAVISNIQAGNFEPGTTIGMSPTLFDGTAEVVGTRQTLPQFKYSPFQTIYETDNSGSSWNSSEVNSIQVGFKSIA